MLFCTALMKLVQVSMDGPNVNWSFLSKLKTHLLIEPDSSTIINTGSCALRIVRAAFKVGHKESRWKIDTLLYSLFLLFKDSTVRPAKYAELTGSEQFFRFCCHRWLKNVKPMDTALYLWTQVTKYVKTISPVLLTIHSRQHASYFSSPSLSVLNNFY
jgi:hypothetical protein